jgi:apolipoprotein D and lipocalin family protein
MKRASNLPVIGVLAAVATGLAVGLAIGAGRSRRAPQPARPVDPALFFRGRWHEIGRTPMKLTDGCVAGTTDYYRDAKGRLIQDDACRRQTPAGPLKSFAGPVTILDRKANTKFRVTYKVFKVLPAPRSYWVLDHADDYAWFIASDPSFDYLGLFTRAANPDPALVEQLIDRAKALGYETSRLEFPAQFPPGPVGSNG